MAFLVFEGIDGSGKSTLIQGLVRHLESKGLSYKVTREPGGTPLAEEIRELLIAKREDHPVPRAEILLYQAARAQHVEKVIHPELGKNTWVLCDRFTYSSLAFQAGGRGLNEDEIQWLNAYATNQLKPDLVVLLDLPIEESQKRQAKRCKEKGVELDRFETEKNDFHQKVRDHYLKQWQEDPKSWLKMDARLQPEELLNQLLLELKEREWLS